MKYTTDDFLVKVGKRFKLKDMPTEIAPIFNDKADYKDKLQKHVEELSSLQNLLYGSDKYALLLIFQGMDASGKDGIIKHVFSGVNPQGCEVHSFKQPSAEELQHDFLWRTTCKLPERGRFGIFNRSYYEEVLVVKVHPEYLVAQGIPKEKGDDRIFWEHRYQSINNFEEHLEWNNTKVLKFFLNLSRSEQEKRLLARIDDPEKNWKFNSGDIEERQKWKQYAEAYEECISATSTKHAPWYAIPADDKKTARLLVSQIIVDKLKSLKMEYPRITPQQKQELEVLRTHLQS